ncbi:MAG: hypothetical protein LBR08_02635 [Bacteroidales bacterium]|jgi:hypothetical protein|nr:hypothetical protein [Bacteroidales bacterium]
MTVFTLRRGKWKLLLSPSSGGWSYLRPGKDAETIGSLPEVQLYNPETDIAEQHNVYAEHPEFDNEFRTLLSGYVENVRSASDIPQKMMRIPGNSWNEWKIDHIIQ